jgi:capsid protein
MGKVRVHLPAARAKFDAASMTPEAMRHWRGADNLSADAELLPEIRRLVVGRSRFEVANNGFLGGILQTLADDTVGTGPRLQLYFDDPDYDIDRDDDRERAKLQRREIRFRKYTRQIKLASKLRLARLAKARDGEVFFQKVVNPKLRGENKIDLVLYETEQVGSNTMKDVEEYWKSGVPKEVDGILYDRNGNPTQYRFWRVHPGAINGVGSLTDFYLVPADAVIHYAHVSRPGQHRGFPEIAGGLTVFNDLRRYANAVVSAAETAAVISLILETDTIPDADDYDLTDELNDEGKRVRQIRFTDVVPIAKNAGVALAEGWKAHQLKAEQPTSTYSDFVDAKLNEAARALSMPFNVAKGNSSGYNYASGRLDHQVYHRKIAIERREIEETILDDLFDSWERIDRMCYPEDYDFEFSTDHSWMWDGFAHVDPAKEASAQASRLASGTTTLQEECAAQGKDYEVVLRQRGHEEKLKRKYGVPTDGSAAAPTQENTNEEE